MIDPTRITQYNRSQEQLEEVALFCIAAAGKNAKTTAKLLLKLLGEPAVHPFETIRRYKTSELLQFQMRKIGFGCHRLKSRGFFALAKSGFDLKTVTVEQLESIPGVGMKTSRFFLMHNFRQCRYACLDRHILKFMSLLFGVQLPLNTPSKKRYLLLEKLFLKLCSWWSIRPADLDLKIWNYFAQKVPPTTIDRFLITNKFEKPMNGDFCPVNILLLTGQNNAQYLDTKV